MQNLYSSYLSYYNLFNMSVPRRFVTGSPDKDRQSTISSESAKSKSKIAHLASYTIKDTDIGDEETKDILLDIKERPGLMHFTIENSNITNENFTEIVSRFKDYDRIEGMNFRGCGLKDQSVMALSEGIKIKKELRVRGA
jgi:hypothetical protein